MRQTFFEITSNTASVNIRNVSLIFWGRAMASCGWLEGYRHRTGFYISLHALGWAVSLTGQLPDRGEGYFRSWFKIELPWLHYDENRGGIFAHWKWAQRRALRVQAEACERRAEERRLEEERKWREARYFIVTQRDEDGTHYLAGWTSSRWGRPGGLSEGATFWSDQRRDAHYFCTVGLARYMATRVNRESKEIDDGRHVHLTGPARVRPVE